jgi:DNA-binding CsgD family transcriptional regulator
MSNIILNLYDSASKGQSYLLETLCRLFNCQATSIQEFPCNEDPFNTLHILRSEPPNSLISQANYKLRSETPRDLKSTIKLDKGITALLFKANNLVHCYLLIHYSNPSNQSPPFIQEKEELSDHIIEALNIAYKITLQENDLKSTHYVLDHYPIPAMAIDDNLNTIFINQAAQRLLQKSSPQMVSKQENLLKLCQPDSYYKLKQSLTSSLSGNTTTSSHLVINFNDAPLALIITTTNTVPNAFRHFSRNNISWVYLLNPDYTTTLKSHPEFQALGLSIAEFELSSALFNGQSLNDIAENRHVSKQTVRKQLQSVLRKTDCESQENLMIFFFENYIHYGLTK